MKEHFKETRFRAATLGVIEQANEIITEYMDDGYDLTLRQLYYQFVARDLIANSQAEYNKLGTIISNARMAGLTDWSAIKDRTRAMRKNSHWSSPIDIVSAVAKQFAVDTRANQDWYCEVWVEKEALAGVIERACDELDVPWFACRGYVSLTAMYEAGKRFKRAEDSGQNTIIFHLGDHDPSGIDMTRDIKDRLYTFGSDVEVERIALNMDQVDEYGPPPNPVKLTDSRCTEYMTNPLYNNQCWELDALDPHVIAELIQGFVSKYTDDGLRNKLIEEQDGHKEVLQAVADNWDRVVKYLN